MSDYHISDHAYERAKKRLGWKKKTLERMLPRVVAKGVDAQSVSGAVKRYIQRNQIPNQNHPTWSKIVLFMNSIFVFKGGTLITVFPIKSIRKQLVQNAAQEIEVTSE